MDADNLTFRAATDSDVDAIMQIIDDARRQMLDEGKHQWDESYPLQAHIEADIRQQHACVLCSEGRVVAYAAVIFGEEPAYRHIVNGEWQSSLPYVVVHRLAVSHADRRCGLGRCFMQQVERLTLRHGLHSFRVDTNYDNDAMLHLLRSLGFRYCGEIVYDRGRRMAFEKLL